MRMKLHWNCEKLDQFSWRVQVYGGWIVYSESRNTKNVALTSTFVSDRNHEWLVLNPYTDEIPAE